MLDLELATTEQILDELARRPIQFVFVSMFSRGNDRLTGYLAHSPHLGDDDALLLLRRAEQFFDEPTDEGSTESYDEQHFDDES
jgi:hypothetical protein